MRYSADKVHDDIKSRLKQNKTKKRSFYIGASFFTPLKTLPERRLNARGGGVTYGLYKKHMNICRNKHIKNEIDIDNVFFVSYNK